MLKRSYLLDSSVSSALLLQRGIGYRKELRHSPGDAYVGLLQRNTLARSTKFQIAKFLKNPESGDIYAGSVSSFQYDFHAMILTMIQASGGRVHAIYGRTFHMYI